VGLTAGLDRCGKSRPHRDSIPGSSSPLRVAIPTTPSIRNYTVHDYLTVSVKRSAEATNWSNAAGLNGTVNSLYQTLS
jgi:hypothetical protein